LQALERRNGHGLLIDASAPPVVPAQFAAEEPYDCLVGEKMWRNRRDLFYDGGR
jgi:hypothetical protein